MTGMTNKQLIQESHSCLKEPLSKAVSDKKQECEGASLKLNTKNRLKKNKVTQMSVNENEGLDRREDLQEISPNTCIKKVTVLSQRCKINMLNLLISPRQDLYVVKLSWITTRHTAAFGLQQVFQKSHAGISFDF